MNLQLNDPERTQSCFGNYEPTSLSILDGPGEQGLPYYYPEALKEEVKKSLQEYGINEVSSNLIALNRSIPDTRNRECKHWYYPEHLPNTSVIIVFHNEALSILIRTFHTVLYRTPEKILHEIILIDDFSDKFNLKENLEKVINENPYYKKVKLFRNKQREGLIRSKINGVRKATGKVVVFLDAHCEVNTNWLPPLLAPIVKNYKTMTVPFIDGIDYLTFKYEPTYSETSLFKGIFEWGMFYKERSLSEDEINKRKYKTEPYYSPTHAGGLFAINREYFLELGIYDPGLLIWGGENFELSFKIWQCGGNIKWVPCSRVGHIYRNPTYSFAGISENITAPIDQYNYKRVIEVWFDNKYKEYFYTRNPLTKYINIGDISEQLALKKRLNCKNFDWYMENVASEVYEDFPKPPPNLYWGQIKAMSTERCLEVRRVDIPFKIEISQCLNNSGEQVFRLNSKGQLTHGERCVEFLQNKLSTDYCSMGTVSGFWYYDFEGRMIHHEHFDKCLSLGMPYDDLYLEECDDQNIFQRWEFTDLSPK